MNDHDTLEAREKRANQTDPIIVYLIVRESLNMSIGKTAAQCAHASQMLQIAYEEHKQELLCGWEPSRPFSLSLYEDWLGSSFRKVVLKADDKEWEKLKEVFPYYQKIIVIDAGLTEIAPNSETVMGFFPMKKSEVPPIIKKLQTLK